MKIGPQFPSIFGSRTYLHNEIKSPPTFSTIAKCFASVATSPAVAATPAHEAEEDI